MKRICYALAVLALLFISSCGTLRNGSGSTLYNKHNRDKVKIKDGLFSSPRAYFGNFATSSIDRGVNKQLISFKKLQDPFHFTLTENETTSVKVEAVYTTKASFKKKELPEIFSYSDVQKIFYAWISGSSANTLKNWELIVKNPSYQELSGNGITGVLRSADDELEIHANNRSGNSQSYDELCFEFQLKGIPIAAVQVNGKKKYVWMQSTLSDEIKYAVAGAMAALLLKE